jgi:ABC-type oligopeptide transport system substrate-binding subunit
MRNNIIGTGPFQMDDWIQQDGIYTSAIPNHWRKSPYVQGFDYIEVPEPASRSAILASYGVEISDVSIKDWPALFDTGSIDKAPEGSKQGFQWPWGGNYWENVDPRPGMNNAPIERIRHTDRAWIGDPYENGNEFDPNTESMQRSLKVRKALSMAIDRNIINEIILSGLAVPAYNGVVSAFDPLWTANADQWTIPYNPDQARTLLEEAGYAEGGIELDWWAGLNSTDIEISEAIAADWLSSYNIQSNHDRRTYTTIRPSMLQREFPVLRMHSCCKTPTDWPGQWTMSATGINAYNYGLEFPEATRVQLGKASSTDPEVVTQLSTDFVQYVSDWELVTSVAEIDVAPLYNTDKVASWDMRPLTNNRLGGIKSPEKVRLR